MATLSVTAGAPAANATVAGTGSASSVPVAAALTATVSAAVVAPVRSSVKRAAAPSVTGISPVAAIQTVGCSGLSTGRPLSAAAGLPARSRMGSASGGS